ncbi:ALP1-like protein [Tanacetum coccineum]|uniref:ALP1-like protein n=1 Tax=Tanacetum coccineum TaxID=301880 RepID=A0ABQ5HBW9_9ASTR
MSFDLFFYTSSDDEDEVNSELAMFTEACQAAYEASKPKLQRTPIEKDRYDAHDRLVMSYFSKHPQYDETTFCDRFRMSRRLFTKIVQEVTDASLFFQQKDDCTGHLGISSLMKCTSAIRQMVYGAVPDSLNKYLQIGATTAHGFPEMLGSIDCTHWPWENCPVAFKAQFCRGDHEPDPFILLEAIASNHLWIWQAFFGVSGMNNDVNVLRQSPIFNDLKSGRALDVPFVANNHEVARKDVKRAFGVLKLKWKLIKYPARGMTQKEQHRDDDPLRTHAKSGMMNLSVRTSVDYSMDASHSMIPELI